MTASGSRGISTTSKAWPQSHVEPDPDADYEAFAPGTEESPIPYEMTDLGNARMLVARECQRFRWCGAMPGNGWMVWDGARWAPDRQVAQLARLSAVARWLPEGPRLAVRAAIDHSSYLTSGQAADLTALLLAAADASGRARQRHGNRWPAVWASIRRRLEAMPAPPSEAVEALIVSAKNKA
jgi:hypothetical protein